MSEVKKQIEEKLKEKVAEIAKTHGKALLHDLNDEVIPLLLDYVAEIIPGQIDNAVIAVAKPPVKSALADLIEKV